jgi:hypothetical protein
VSYTRKMSLGQNRFSRSIPSGNVNPHQAIEKWILGNRAAIETMAKTIHNSAYPHMTNAMKTPTLWRNSPKAGETQLMWLATIPS